MLESTLQAEGRTVQG